MADVFNFDFEEFTSGNAVSAGDLTTMGNGATIAVGTPQWSDGLNGSSTAIECDTANQMRWSVTGDFSFEVRIKITTLPPSSASRTILVKTSLDSWITGIRWKSDNTVHVLDGSTGITATDWENAWSAGDENSTEWIVQLQHDDTNHTGNWRVLDSARRVLYTFPEISYTLTTAVDRVAFGGNSGAGVFSYDDFHVTDQLEWIEPDAGTYVVVNDSERLSEEINVVLSGVEQTATTSVT